MFLCFPERRSNQENMKTRELDTGACRVAVLPSAHWHEQCGRMLSSCNHMPVFSNRRGNVL
jgi:hypothetical protein